MKDDIRTCVDAKINVFKEYFDIPETVRSDLESLFEKIEALGDNCSDVMDFEGRFLQELQQEYNMMFMKITPKARPMTDEEKAESERLSMELQYGTDDPVEVRKMKAKAALKEAADMAQTEAEQEMISMRRKTMIESGTFDDYTRMTNAVEDAKIAGKLLGGLFRKKK